MKKGRTYISFNGNKNIEELKYNLLQYKDSLEDLNIELAFYNFLLGASIFKPRIINLFEMLEKFKIETKEIIKMSEDLQNKISSHINQIENKIECEDLACENFFIEEYEELEHNIYNFFSKSKAFKSSLFQYLLGVIKN
ncbi:MAG: hypothetical protein P8X62_05245 [Flavobacteriaceae bacterium]